MSETTFCKMEELEHQDEIVTMMRRPTFQAFWMRQVCFCLMITNSARVTSFQFDGQRNDGKSEKGCERSWEHRSKRR
jgi:hypothetical protein